MNTSLQDRWLDADATARYISVRVDKLPRLVKDGKLPEPSRHLGPKQPRWDRFALDRMFEGEGARHEESIDDKIQRVIRERRRNTA